MANSKIVITFSSDLEEEAFVSYEIRSRIDNSLVTTIIETWKLTRRNSYEIRVLENGPQITEQENEPSPLNDAQKYQRYFEVDYNYLEMFATQLFGNSIEIQDLTGDYVFANFQTNRDVTASIDNAQVITEFKIESKTVKPALDSCNEVRLNFVFNYNITRYILDNQEYIINSNEFEIDYPRSKDFKVIFYDAEDKPIYYPGQDRYQNVGSQYLLDNIKNQTISYSKLSSENINVNVSAGVSGASVEIVVNEVDNLELTYSLDGINFSESNLFSAQAEGNYTAYVKDNYNCMKSVDFVVDSFGSIKEFAYFSLANAIHFKQLENIDNFTVFKNELNSFDFNSLEKFSYTGYRFFNYKDNPSIQFKSSYKNNLGYIRSEDGVIEPLVVVKKSNNLGRYEKLDCYQYAHSSGKLAIYFESGNIYNSLGQIVSEYSLNGSLPVFAEIGNNISIEGLGSFEINNVFLDSSINKHVILLDYNYSGVSKATKVECLYNLLPYEIYEVVVPLLSMTNKNVDFYFELYNDLESKNIFQSENYFIEENSDDSLFVTYYNNEMNNKDIFYKYGLKFSLRINYSRLPLYKRSESEISINDFTITSISSDLKFGTTFILENLTLNQVKTICLAFSSEFVFINGVSYKKDGEIKEENVENTNLYSLEINMLKASTGYNHNDTVNSGSNDSSEEVYVPRIITDGVNFIKS